MELGLDSTNKSNKNSNCTITVTKDLAIQKQSISKTNNIKKCNSKHAGNRAYNCWKRRSNYNNKDLYSRKSRKEK